MHEYSLVRSLLEQVDALRRERDAESVVEVRISIGQFSGVEPDLFHLAFDALVEGSPMQGAQLQLEQVELAANCDTCGRDFIVEHFHFECPACRSSSVTVVRGEDLILESVTMETTESNHEPAECRR